MQASEPGYCKTRRVWTRALGNGTSPVREALPTPLGPLLGLHLGKTPDPELAKKRRRAMQCLCPQVDREAGPGLLEGGIRPSLSSASPGGFGVAHRPGLYFWLRACAQQASDLSGLLPQEPRRPPHCRGDPRACLEDTFRYGGWRGDQQG